MWTTIYSFVSKHLTAKWVDLLDLFAMAVSLEPNWDWNLVKHDLISIQQNCDWHLPRILHVVLPSFHKCHSQQILCLDWPDSVVLQIKLCLCSPGIVNTHLPDSHRQGLMLPCIRVA